MSICIRPTVDRSESADEMRRRVIAHLGTTFQGDIVGPDHADYASRCAVWNAMVSKRPALILRCTGTADVVAAVEAARACGLTPSVRGGGHNVAGNALVHEGLCIDLGRMRDVVVDAAAHRVHAAGGCQLGDLDAATASHGLVVPAGTVSETGVAGLALGGGVGWLSRKFGLTCDHFESLEVVLADGQVVTVSADQHPDLFWALRGGGGNFGIVTQFTFKARTFGPLIRIGVALHEPAHAAEVLRQYARRFADLPRHVGWHGELRREMPADPFVRPELVGKRLLCMLAVWLGDADDAAGTEFLERLNAVGHPCQTAVLVVPFAAGLQKFSDAEFPDGHRYYTKQGHVQEFSDEAIDRVVEFWKHMPMRGVVQLVGLGGAVGDVPEDASAFASRQNALWLNFLAKWDDAAKDREYVACVRQAVDGLAPWLARSAYSNMLNADEQDRVADIFSPAKYARLQAVKARYDGGNFFRVNVNIRPWSVADGVGAAEASAGRGKAGT